MINHEKAFKKYDHYQVDNQIVTIKNVYSHNFFNRKYLNTFLDLNKSSSITNADGMFCASDRFRSLHSPSIYCSRLGVISF